MTVRTAETVVLPRPARRRRADRSASTSMCRSAPPAADTATSTPTRPPSWAARTPTAGWRRCALSWSWAADLLGTPPDVQTVFVGGGTPSLLGGARPGRRARCGPGALRRSPPTPRSPPRPTRSRRRRSCSPQLRAAGFTRVSLGMQSAAPHVLAALDRVHSPGRALAAAREALAAGFEHVNIDLIYGTPGESDDDLRRSVDAAIEARRRPRVGLRAGRSRTGPRWPAGCAAARLPPPDDDVLAHRYELLDARLRDAGFDWYEVSNWSRPGGECRHNLGYWDGGEWWGAGPGAHGYVGSTRWWNVKHPNAYAQHLGRRAAAGRRFRGARRAATHTEDVMLRLRLRVGLPIRRAQRSGAAPRADRRRRRSAAGHRRSAGAHRPRPTIGRCGRTFSARLITPARAGR